MYATTTDRSYLRSRIPHAERRKKRLEALFKKYNVDRSDPDMTIDELEELATLMKIQPEPRVPDLSKEIYMFIEEIKRLVRQHFEEALKKFQPSNPEGQNVEEDASKTGESLRTPITKEEPQSILKYPGKDKGKKAVRFEIGLDLIPEREEEIKRVTRSSGLEIVL